MTGMGADAPRAWKPFNAKSDFNVGQDEARCTVYSMPRSAAEAGVVHRVVPLLQIPEQTMQLAQYKKAVRSRHRFSALALPEKMVWADKWCRE